MTGKCLRVLVTDGDNRAALSITRSLGRRGHHVVVAARRSPALAQTSRFCAERAVYPDPTQDACGFVNALAELVELHKINVLLPVTDVTTLLVTAHRARFGPACRIPFADVEVIERAADKVDVVQTAIDLGVPVPRTFFLASAAALAGCLSELTFPVVVKPRRSRLQTSEGWTSTSVRYARDAAELAAMVREKHELEFPLLLQERITGPGVGVFVCYNRGVPTAWFSHRRLREKPPSGGVSTLAESIELSPVTRRYSELLLNELGWHGVAMVEFKVDQRDGVPKLMEINGRFWGSLQLAIDAGVDFPALLLEEFDVGKPTVPTYRVGVRSRWFWGDLDSLLITLRGGPRSHSPSGRLRAIAEFLKLWGKDLYYENPRASDLKPWWLRDPAVVWSPVLIHGMEWMFWGSALAIVYAYAGYPLVLSAIARLYRRELPTLAGSDHQLPAVTMIVPVHNERQIIAEKLANTRQIEYPAGKLEVLFVSDGSTDGTSATIAANLDFRSTLIELEGRGGKAGALNAGLAKARHDIIVFSDASIMLSPDAVRKVIQPFQDPRIGCVSGEDWIPAGGGEGLYGRYELFLRGLESSVGSIVGASGSFYAQRRVLCDQFVPNVAPDFLSVLLTVSRGFRAVTCATARGRMTALDSVRDEFRRKVRTILRGITTMMGHSHLLNPFKHGLFAFELLSHKLARWLVPFFLLAMLASSAVLSAGSTLHAVLFAAQVVFYGLAVAGVYGPAAIRRLLVSRVAVYFTTVNLATLMAWLKFATGVRQEVWVPSRREGGPVQRTTELGDRAGYESGSRR